MTNVAVLSITHLCSITRGIIFIFSFLLLLVFVCFARCNFYFYIVFGSQIFTILIFVLVHRVSKKTSKIIFVITTPNFHQIL